jgi:hypothetical protein
MYFGYGINRDPRMISAITGKKVNELVGVSAVLQDFGMAIQGIDQIPNKLNKYSELTISPRDILSKYWDADFKSYVIYPKAGSYVSGTIWELSHDDRERIKDWELLGDWYKGSNGVAVTENCKKVNIVTDSLGNDQQYDYEVDGLEYDEWLQPFNKFKEIAIKTRRAYDSRNK